jgi:predicted ATPase
VLDAELGIAPLPETEALREAIGRGQLAAIPQARSVTSLRENTLSSLPFVGREDERGALNASLQQMLHRQQAQVIALAGELGIGKSRLWSEWSSQLSAQETVIACRCLESTRTIPLAPFTRLVTEVFARPHAPPLEALWLAELARLAPDLKLQYPDLPPPVNLPPEQERGRLFDACVHALLAMGQLPVIFFIDDAHWADQTTLDWLAYCLDQVKRLPLLCVLAYRPQDAPPALSHLLAAWERSGVARQIAIGPLSAEETAQVIAAHKTPPAWSANALYEQSAGNPYYLGELLQTEEARIPPSLGALIQTRLTRLPPVARQVAQVAAILEPDVDVDLLRSTSGRSEDETLDALDSLLEAAFLREGEAAPERQEALSEYPIHYMFAHPFIATILRNGLSSARRVALHRRAAEALAKRTVAQLPPLAGRLYHHYQEAGQWQQAAAYAEMAGMYALASASSIEAETFFQRALELEITAPRSIGLGLAEMQAGKTEAARAAFLQALRLFATQQNAQGTLQALAAYFETYTLLGQFQEAIRWAEQPDIQAYTNLIGPENMAIVRGVIQVMKYRLVTPSLKLAEQESAKLLYLLQTAPNHLLALQAYIMVATTFAEQGSWQKAIDAYRKAAETASARGDLFQEVLARNNMAYHTILLGAVERAREEIEALLALVKRHHLQAAHYYVYSTYAEWWLAQGKWSEAERWLKQAVAEMKQRSDAQAQVAELYANLGRAARGRGDVAAATRLFERASDMLCEAGLAFQRAQVELWLADLYSVSGKEDAARALLEQLGPSLQSSGWQELQRRASHIAQRLRTQTR